jgi:cap2 methyltransferase
LLNFFKSSEVNLAIGFHWNIINYFFKLFKKGQSLLIRMEDLQKLKSEINFINLDIWNKCAKLSNPYELIPFLDNTKRINRSFYKIIEIFKDIQINEPKNVLCLCEAPGGFAEAIKYLFPNANLKVQSNLNSDIQFSKKIPKEWIIYEEIGKGNILNIHTIKDIYTQFGNSIDLITADGAIDSSKDYNNQEAINYPIVLAEVKTALYCLKKGGNFIIKVYDIIHPKVIKLINNVIIPNFECVYCRKLKTSRPCNSEKYLICTNFRSQNIINELNLNTNYIQPQIDALKKTIFICRHLNPDIENEYKLNQKLMSNKFLSEYLKSHTR